MSRLMYRLLAGVVLVGGPCEAALLSGTGGAPNQGVLIDFSAAPAGETTSITLSGVTFSAVGPGDMTIGSALSGLFNTSGQSLSTGADFDPFSIQIDFAAPVSSFAFNWGALLNKWTLVALDSSLAVIESYSIGPTVLSNAGDYFGISASGISRVLLVNELTSSPNGDLAFMDDFSFAPGSQAVVPAPSTLSAMCLGLLSLGVWSLRRKAH